MGLLWRSAFGFGYSTSSATLSTFLLQSCTRCSLFEPSLASKDVWFPGFLLPLVGFLSPWKAPVISYWQVRIFLAPRSFVWFCQPSILLPLSSISGDECLPYPSFEAWQNPLYRRSLHGFDLFVICNLYSYSDTIEAFSSPRNPLAVDIELLRLSSIFVHGNCHLVAPCFVGLALSYACINPQSSSLDVFFLTYQSFLWIVSILVCWCIQKLLRALPVGACNGHELMLHLHVSRKEPFVQLWVWIIGWAVILWFIVEFGRTGGLGWTDLF